jgi:hypothetical protein
MNTSETTVVRHTAFLGGAGYVCERNVIIGIIAYRGLEKSRNMIQLAKDTTTEEHKKGEGPIHQLDVVPGPWAFSDLNEFLSLSLSVSL